MTSPVGALPSLPVLPDTVPPELEARRQWVAWHWVERGAKWTKPPLNPRSGKLASTTDPTSWGTITEVRGFCADNSEADGIGFVFTEDDPYAGVDLDKCRDPETGVIDHWALQVIGYLCSYAEVSPSGRGVKVFLKATLPAGGLRRGPIEIYDRGRYFTVTGHHIREAPEEIQQRQAGIDLLIEWLAGPRAAESTGRAGPAPGDLDDEQLLERAKGARNGEHFGRLWNGDWTGYPSQSEADLALASMLAFWTGRDEARIDGLFRRSRLYRRKWDERHYGDGRTYGTVTIERAVRATATTFSDGRDSGHSPILPSGNESGRPEVGGDEDEPLETDLGNAVRLARRHGEDICYCFTTNTFHVWTGTQWPPDQTGEIYRRAKETVRSIFREAAAAPSADKSKLLAQHAVKSQGEARIAALVALVRSEPGIPITPAQLDSDPWLLNVLNGTIDLRTGRIIPHSRSHLITKIARVRYDPNAKCPLWLRFLDRITEGNSGLVRFLQKAVGYSLTGDVSEQVVFFLYGTGANGKSTFVGTVLDLLGDYGKQAAPGLLTIKRGDSHPTELADLAGTRFVASVEVDEGRRLAETLTKWLTGGDRIKARFMRQDFFEFSPTHKLWLAANHKPAILGTDHAIWRRLRLIPFRVAIPESEQDKLLGNKLRRELPGILKWAAEGCLLWQSEGLLPPDEVTEATNTYREEQDTLGGFLQDCCEVGPDRKASAKDLYGQYKTWCEENGEHPLAQKAFGSRLAERGFSGGHRGTNGQRWWKGLGLVTRPGLDSNMSDA